LGHCCSFENGRVYVFVVRFEAFYPLCPTWLLKLYKNGILAILYPKNINLPKMLFANSAAKALCNMKGQPCTRVKSAKTQFLGISRTGTYLFCVVFSLAGNITRRMLIFCTSLCSKYFNAVCVATLAPVQALLLVTTVLPKHYAT